MGNQLFWRYFDLMLDVHRMNPMARELSEETRFKVVAFKTKHCLRDVWLRSLRLFADVGKCARIWKIWCDMIIYMFLSEIALWPGQYWWVLDYTGFLPPKLSITLFWIISVYNFLIRYLGNRNSWHLFNPTDLHLPSKRSPGSNKAKELYILPVIFPKNTYNMGPKTSYTCFF